MEGVNESARDKAARRRTKRLQHLMPDEALRRSPRIRRSGVTPFYGPAPRRASRESSLAMDDDASSVASSGSRRSRSSRRSSRASEMLNESGQVLYEGSESEADQDVTVVASSRGAACVHRVTYQVQQVDQALGQLMRSPRSLNSGDSGVASSGEWAAVAQGNARCDDQVREAAGADQTDLPPHLFGPDSDGEMDFTKTTKYVCNKKRVLLPPPPPGVLASLFLFIKRVAALPYLFLVSVLTFDLLLLERLSLLLAIATNPTRGKKTWFGLLVLVLVLLGCTWWLIGEPPHTPSDGVTFEDLKRLRHSVISETWDHVAKSKSELLHWLQGNLTELSKVQERLAADLDTVGAASVTRHSAVTIQLNATLDGLSAMTEQLANLTSRLVGLEQQVAHLQDSNSSTHSQLQQLRVEVSGAVDGAQQLKKQVEGELLALRKDCCGEGLTAKDVQEKVEKMLGEDGGVFGSWLQSHMVGVVRQEDMDAFNASLRELVIKWRGPAGGLTRWEVEDMVKTALQLYDADRTGKFDYALETAGGSIPHALCSETFTPSASTVQLFGYTVWQYSNSPRTIIQPGVLPGQCWAFTGAQGYVVIKLATNIHLSEVTVEHIPRSLSPTGEIESAPKDFSLYVGETEEEERHFLGNYTYLGEKPRETIPVQVYDGVVRFLEFRFLSNHGNKDYTCVYRLRVHGRPASTLRKEEQS